VGREGVSSRKGRGDCFERLQRLGKSRRKNKKEGREGILYMSGLADESNDLNLILSKRRRGRKTAGAQGQEMFKD